MFKEIIGKIWGITPSGIRLKIIRVTQKKFTVSVTAIITNSAGKVLLLEHWWRPQASGWGIPGGFIEHGEQPETAIRREIREETGLELKNPRMVRVRTIRQHIEILFRAEAQGTAEVCSSEIKSLDWFLLDEMPSEMSEIQKKLVREILEIKFS